MKIQYTLRVIYPLEKTTNFGMTKFVPCIVCKKNIDHDVKAYHINIEEKIAQTSTSSKSIIHHLKGYNICMGCAPTEKEAKKKCKVLYSLSLL